MMSRHGAIERAFGESTYTFRLGLAQIEEMEDQLGGASLFAIARRLDPHVRDARLGDISEVIRLGLIGGGMKPVDALAKVQRYVDARPLDESRDLAWHIVRAGLARVYTAAEPPPGEAQAPRLSVSTSAPSEATP